jgi:hypothetical protein
VLDLGTSQRKLANLSTVLLRANLAATVFLLLIAITRSWIWPSGIDTVVEAAQFLPAEVPKSISAAEVTSKTTGRAPFRTTRVVKPKVVDEVAAYVLVGVSVRGETPKAYVRDTKLKKMLIKKRGESLGSYEIEDITREGLTLIRGAERVLLPK